MGQVSEIQSRQGSAISGHASVRKPFDIVLLELDGSAASSIELLCETVSSVIFESGQSGDSVGIVRTSQDSQSSQSSGSVATVGSVNYSQPVNVTLIQGAA